MIETAGLVTFAFVSSLTPGPNNVLMTSLGASMGIRRSLPALFGIAFGIAVMIFLISIGMGRFITEAGATLTIGMRFVGFAIILWMAWQIAAAPVSEVEVREEAPSPTGGLRTFFGTASFQWVNPKAWIICASVITAYLDQETSLFQQAIVFALVFVFAALAGCTPWLLAGNSIGRLLQGTRARLFNRIMAVLLIGSMIPIIH